MAEVTGMLKERQLPARDEAERARELAALLEVSSRLASTLDLEQLLSSLFEQFKRVVDFSSVAVSFVDEDGHFSLLEYKGPPPEPLARTRWRPSEADPPQVRDIFQLRSPLIIPDVYADTPDAQTWRANARRTRGYLPRQARSWMATPLLADERTVGMLFFEHGQAGYYTERHAELALALANHAAVAIENARLFRLEQRRSEQFRLIGEVSQQITRILALEEVANQATYLIQQAFGYAHVHIGLVEDGEVVFKSTAGVCREERECHYCNKRRYVVGETGAAGRVAAGGQPLMVPDVRNDPFYLPMTGEQVGSALILPLKVGAQVIGVLNMESDEVGGFDAMDVGVLQPLANQLAIALENARLYEQSRALAALQERQKLARELHDSVSQALYGIGLGARTAIKLLESENPDRENLASALDYVLSLATAGLAEMRALIFELRPESLEKEGLVAALTRHVEALRARHGLSVDTLFDAEPALSVAGKEVLYRVAQEALQNVVKHANAGHVQVTLAVQEGQVLLEIRDDGQGFDVQGRFPGHLGLQSMRERVEGAGGALDVQSAPGRGTKVRAVAPFVEGQRPAKNLRTG